MDKRQSGRQGEKIASDFLQSLGYQILAMNYYTRYGEIDIIAKEKDVLVFVEVKKRSTARYGTGAQAVTPKKIAKIRTCAGLYLQENELYNQELRFDIVEISGGGANGINHIIAAF